jgi:uncharacterized protein with FMN-binding domain
MRRAAACVLGTIVGTSVLVGAKLGNTPMGGVASTTTGDGTGTGGVVVGGGPATGTPAGTGPQATGAPGAPGATSHPTTPGAPGATTAHPGQPTPTGTSHPTSAPTTTKPGSTPTHTTTPTPTPTPTQSGYKDGTYTASAPVRNGNYGTLNMTVTISGGKITAISASEVNPTESNCYHSKCPTLISEALSAQSANIASVSGATYTSAAFMASLQAILNSA